MNGALLQALLHPLVHEGFLRVSERAAVCDRFNVSGTYRYRCLILAHEEVAVAEFVVVFVFVATLAVAGDLPGLFVGKVDGSRLAICFNGFG